MQLFTSRIITNLVSLDARPFLRTVLLACFLLQASIWLNGQTISITKSHSGSLKAGDVITYTIMASNNTSATLSNVNLSDPVPGSPAVFVPNSLIVSGTSLTCSVPTTITNAILISGFNLLPQESITYTFQMKIPSDYSGTGTIAHTVDVNAGTATASTSNPISALPNLVIVKSGVTDIASGKVNKTGLINYTIVVTNGGTANANSVVITDKLDIISKVNIVAANNVVVSQSYIGTYTINKGNNITDDSIRISLGTIPMGGSATITFRVRVKPTATGDVTNTAIAASSNLTGGTSAGTVSSNTSTHTINTAADCTNRDVYYLSFNGNDGLAEVNNPNKPWQSFLNLVNTINAGGGNAIIRFLDAYYPTSVSGATAPTLSTNCVTIDGNYCIFDRNSGASVGFLNVTGQNDTIRNLRLTNFNKSPDCSFNITGTASVPIKGFYMDDVRIFGTQAVKATTFTFVEWANIKNCEWSNNPNGGIDITDCTMNFTDCKFHCNYRPSATGGDGGAIYATTSGTTPVTNKTILKFTGCNFYDNRAFGLAGDGGAIYAGDNIKLNITNSSFLSNYSDGTSAGAIRLNLSSKTVINNCKFRRNYCSAASLGGGAIYVAGTSGLPSSYPYLTITNSEFDENWATTGGAIVAQACNLKLRGNYFQKNVAATSATLPASGTGLGGAISLIEHEYNNFDFVPFAGTNPSVTAPTTLPLNPRVQYMGTDSSMWVYNGASYINQFAAIRDSFMDNVFASSPDQNKAGANGGACIFTGGGSSGTGNYKGVNLYGSNNTIPNSVFLNLSPNVAPSSVLGNGQANDWAETDLFNRTSLGVAWTTSAAGVSVVNSGTLGNLRMTAAAASTLYATTSAPFTSLASGNIKAWTFSADQTGFNSTNFGYCVITSTHADPTNAAASGYAIKVLAGSLQLGRFATGLTSFVAFGGTGTVALSNTDLFVNCVVTFNPSTKVWNIYKGEERGLNSDPREVYTATVGVGASPGNAYTANGTFTVSGANDITATSFPFTGFGYTTSGSGTKNVQFDDFWIGNDQNTSTIYDYTAITIPSSCPANPTSGTNCITFSDLGNIALSGCKFLNTYTGDFATATPVTLPSGVLAQSMTALVSNFFPVNSPANTYEWRYLIVNASNVIVQVVTPASHTNVTNTTITPSFSPVVAGTYTVYGYYFNKNSTSAPTVGTTLSTLTANICGSLSKSFATFEILNPIVETVTASCAQNGLNACPNRYFGTITVTGGYPSYADANGLAVPQYTIGMDKTYVPTSYTNEATGWVSLGASTSYVNTYNAGPPVQSFGVKTEDDGNCTPYPFALDLAVFATPSDCKISITGKVFEDNDGGSISGNGINNPSGVQLYAYLISTTASPVVVAVVPINADGTYSFTENFAPNTYSVYLSTQSSIPIGSTTLPTLTLPSVGQDSWTNVADGLVALGDGSPDGMIGTVVVESTSNITNVNFAIKPPTVFPITLLSFTGKLENNKSELSWLTASEINASHFEMEHADRNGEFEPIGKVTAAQNSNTFRSYHFTDINPNVGVNRYRLKMVDIDGTYTYSNTVSLLKDADIATLAIFPNPTETKAILLHPFSSQNAKIQIYDSKGSLVKTFVSAAYTDQTEIYTKGIDRGVYTLIWEDGHYFLIQKWVVY